MAQVINLIDYRERRLGNEMARLVWFLISVRRR